MGEKMKKIVSIIALLGLLLGVGATTMMNKGAHAITDASKKLKIKEEKESVASSELDLQYSLFKVPVKTEYFKTFVEYPLELTPGGAMKKNGSYRMGERACSLKKSFLFAGVAGGKIRQITGDVLFYFQKAGFLPDGWGYRDGLVNTEWYNADARMVTVKGKSTVQWNFPLKDVNGTTVVIDMMNPYSAGFEEVKASDEMKLSYKPIDQESGKPSGEEKSVEVQPNNLVVTFCFNRATDKSTKKS